MQRVAAVAAAVLWTAAAAAGVTTHDDHHDHPHHDDQHRADIQQRTHRRASRHSKSAPLDVTTTDWWWVPVVVVGVFCVFMLMTRKFERLGGHSLRHVLTKYYSVDALYHTLAGAKPRALVEQRDIEIGHQALVFLGCGMLLADWLLNVNRDERYAVAALTSVQLVVMVCTAIADCVLLKAGFIRPVRSVNTKLRFAHCIYQVLLFSADAISTDFSMAVPVDCFVWATLHYCYEAIGLALEGLNVIGMSELAIILIVNARLITSTEAATGWRCAFALSSLGLSSFSMLAGLIWKLSHLHHDDRLTAPADADAHSTHDEHTGLAEPLVVNAADGATSTAHSDANGAAGATSSLRRRPVATSTQGSCDELGADPQQGV